jgi:glutamine amidotransferase
MSDSPTASVGVIDYGAGNLRSVCNALAHLGANDEQVRLVRNPDDFDGLERLIFPGVGAFGDCAEAIDRQDLRAPLIDWLSADRPFFGICVGYQVLFEESEESPDQRGLGFFEGSVKKFSFPEPERRHLKIPHMGWNEIRLKNPDLAFWQGLPAHPHVYFVHSFYPQPADQTLISATTDYGGEFGAAIQSGNITATQFHPERSQSVGLRLLGNFLGKPAPVSD